MEGHDSPFGLWIRGYLGLNPDAPFTEIREALARLKHPGGGAPASSVSSPMRLGDLCPVCFSDETLKTDFDEIHKCGRHVSIGELKTPCSFAERMAIVFRRLTEQALRYRYEKGRLPAKWRDDVKAALAVFDGLAERRDPPSYQ